MLTVLRNVGAWIAGVVAGIATVIVLEAVNHQIWPPPADLDPTDAEAIAAVMAQAPLGVFVALLVTWGLAAFAGGGVASALASWRRVLVGALAAGMTLLGTVMNLIVVPHPTWVTVLGPVVVVLGMTGGVWVGTRLPAIGGQG